MEFYFQNSLAPSTQRTYTSAKNRYSQFCNQYNFPVLPVSEHQLCQYVSFLAEAGLSHVSIKCYLSAIRHLQIAHSLPDPHISSMPKLEGVIKGIKSQQAKKQPVVRPRLPITPVIMQKMRAVWEKDSRNQDNIMLWAAVCACFFGFMRSGEITVPSESAYDPGAHLTYSDVSIDDPGHPTLMKLRLKASKTDPFRKGVDIVMGRTYNELCPIEAMLAFLAIRGNKQGFLFTFADGRLLTKDRFVTRVRAALEEAGLNKKSYAGHSFRIGAATTASLCGISEATIKMLGRWESAAYQLYIHTPRESLARVSALISSSSKKAS